MKMQKIPNIFGILNVCKNICDHYNTKVQYEVSFREDIQLTSVRFIAFNVEDFYLNNMED